MEAIMTHQSKGLLPIRVIKSIATSPNNRVKNTLWVLSWLSSHHGISDMSAKAKRFSAYFPVERVWTYPSTNRKAKMGNAILPIVRIKSYIKLPCSMR